MLGTAAPLVAARCLQHLSVVVASNGVAVAPQQLQQHLHLQRPQLAHSYSVRAAHADLGFRTSDGQPLNQSGLEAARLLKRYNLAIPQLQGSVILAKVIKVDESGLLVDPGYFSLTRIPKADLASAQACTAAGNPVAREAPPSSRPGLATRFRPGDYVQVRLSELFTPFGDVQLDPVQVPAQVRDKVVWEELSDRMTKGVTVQGRLLNRTSTQRHGALVHGWAVGVAGFVAFVQDGNVTPDKMQQVGSLQEFYIHYMDRLRKKIFLSMTRQTKNIYVNTI